MYLFLGFFGFGVCELMMVNDCWLLVRCIFMVIGVVVRLLRVWEWMVVRDMVVWWCGWFYFGSCL